MDFVSLVQRAPRIRLAAIHDVKLSVHFNVLSALEMSKMKVNKAETMRGTESASTATDDDDDYLLDVTLM